MYLNLEKNIEIEIFSDFYIFKNFKNYFYFVMIH